jgi:hypothetical protein
MINKFFILSGLIFFVLNNKNYYNSEYVIVTKNCNYYEITILKKNHFSINYSVLSKHIDINELSINSLDSFLCSLNKNRNFIPLYVTREDYFNECNLSYNIMDDAHFEAKFYMSFKENANCMKLKLKTGEKVKIKAVSISGKFLKFPLNEVWKKKLSSINYFSNNCTISEFYIPYHFEKIEKIKQ